jgi:hypothetical protein
VAGVPSSAGARISTVALSCVQSRSLGVIATEQMRSSAVSIEALHIRTDKHGFARCRDALSDAAAMMDLPAIRRRAWNVLC